MSSYVYIFINPSLKGLLKIGTTNRSPEERALELSAATNMPTPFVVAYEELVPDGYLAERLIHEELTDAGFRLTDNREFFSVPLKQAIAVMSKVADYLRANVGDSASPSDEEISIADSGEYYLHKGLKELTGDENTLQDYKAAYESFTRAIDLGCVRAYCFLAHMHTLGLGVAQSANKVLSILKEGGSKGDWSCYKSMWDIYAGNTILDSKNENNAEVCFQWIIDHSTNRDGEEVLAGALLDYLHHSYDRLNRYGDKFPLGRFSGRHFTFVIEMCTKRMQQAFLEVRAARISGITNEQLDVSWRDSPSSPNAGDIILIESFLSDSTTDGDGIMKKAMAGIERADLEYFLSRARDPSASVRQYLRYLTTVAIGSIDDSSDRLPEKKKGGFFARLFS